MKFLIVEDDSVTSRLWESYISDYGPCTIAADGIAAVEAVRKSLKEGQPYDMICLDVMMPKMDGHGALRLIRQAERTQQINESDSVKIIMTTALDNIRHIEKAFSSGCQAYLVKPIRKQQLLEKMEKFGLIESAASKK